MENQAVIARHNRIALQFSGGRDSIACLYLMRPYWDALTVYWCDTGSTYPETLSLVCKVRDMVPNFAVIQGLQPEVIAHYGMPSDIVRASATPMGVQVGGGPLMQDRHSCCLRSKMIPLHQRMLDDGVTLIIRGQKSADKMKAPVKSGEIHDCIEYLFPLEDWDARKVMAYLREQDAPIPRFYEMLNSAPDCLTCSAWWEEGSMAYLKRYHHAQYLENRVRLDAIRTAVGEHIAAFNREL